MYKIHHIPSPLVCNLPWIRIQIEDWRKRQSKTRVGTLRAVGWIVGVTFCVRLRICVCAGVCASVCVFWNYDGHLTLRSKRKRSTCCCLVNEKGMMACKTWLYTFGDEQPYNITFGRVKGSVAAESSASSLLLSRSSSICGYRFLTLIRAAGKKGHRGHWSFYW